MSEPYPDAGGAAPAPGFMQQRFMGIPAVIWLAGAAVVAYFLFFRGSSSGTSSGGGATSTGGGGTPSTGDITVQPGTETIDLSGTTAATGTGVTDTAPNDTVTSGTGGSVVNGPAKGVAPNPQPTPAPKPKTKTAATAMVTVAKWPGKTSGGLAQWNTTLWGIANHYHTTVAELMKLNPNIKNANLIYPGQKIKVPTGK